MIQTVLIIGIVILFIYSLYKHYKARDYKRLSEAYLELDYTLKSFAKEIKESDKKFEELIKTVPSILKDDLSSKYKGFREEQLNSLIEAIIQWSSKEEKYE